MRRFSVLLLRRIANRNLSLYKQLDVLERCGITPNHGVEVAQLLAHYTEREYETSPFRRLLAALGSESADQAPLSDNVWRLRVGCIAGPGDYTLVAQRMSLLTGGALPISDIREQFDMASGLVWLMFRLSAQEIRWPGRIREFWVDPVIFSRFAALLEAQDIDKRFTQLDLGGQYVLIGCSTPVQFTELRRWTGLPFEWLG